MIVQQENVPTERMEQQKNQSANETNTRNFLRKNVPEFRFACHLPMAIYTTTTAFVLVDDAVAAAATNAYLLYIVKSEHSSGRCISGIHHRRRRRRRCAVKVYEVNLSPYTAKRRTRWKLIRNVNTIAHTHSLTHRLVCKSAHKLIRKPKRAKKGVQR